MKPSGVWDSISKIIRSHWDWKPKIITYSYEELGHGFEQLESKHVRDGDWTIKYSLFVKSFWMLSIFYIHVSSISNDLYR